MAWAGGCSGGEGRDAACLRRSLPPLRRGHAWEIPGRRSGHTLLVIEADPALSAFPRTAVTVLVDTTGTAPDTLLSTRITAPVVGDVIDTQIMTLTVSAITAGKYLGIAPDEEMSALSRTLRIALDLTDKMDAPARVPAAPQRGRVGGGHTGHPRVRHRPRPRRRSPRWLRSRRKAAVVREFGSQSAVTLARDVDEFLTAPLWRRVV
ncbi:hypothetical protein GCM10009646_61770 [Streptomyces aureus]